MESNEAKELRRVIAGLLEALAATDSGAAVVALSGTPGLVLPEVNHETFELAYAKCYQELVKQGVDTSAADAGAILLATAQGLRDGHESNTNQSCHS